MRVTLAVLVFLSFYAFSLPSQASDRRLRILCYHEIGISDGTPYALDRKTFVEQISYLKSHGFHFISAEDLFKALSGKKKLPEKPVLLTFDDAYKSFYEFVFPLLKRLKIPAVLGVVVSWIEKGPPPGFPYPLMNWKEIKEVARSPWVEVASHSYALHRWITYTPQGNVFSAVAVRRYFPEEKRYENLKEYLERVEYDLKKSLTLLWRHTGYRPRILVWPYGRFNRLAQTKALESGFELSFSLEDPRGNNLETIENIKSQGLVARRLLPPPNMKDFIKVVEEGSPPNLDQIRGLFLDLDLIYDPDPRVTEENLGRFIERALQLGVNTVFLAGFSDPDGDTVADGVYFSTSVLPVRADILGWAANRLMVRGIKVFVWMPTLRVLLPDPEKRNKLCVHRGGKCFPGKLSPFVQDTQKILLRLYEDLAQKVVFDGIMFEDDATLFEDEDTDRSKNSTEIKVKVLENLLDTIKDKVRLYRPYAYFGRLFYAGALFPWGKVRFAQNFSEGLKHYDFPAVMAYCEMEAVKSCKVWLTNLVKRLSFYQGKNKTLIVFQSFDWRSKRCISTFTLWRRFRFIQALGVRNIAYYPDNLFDNCPEANIIRMITSTQTFYK